MKLKKRNKGFDWKREAFRLLRENEKLQNRLAAHEQIEFNLKTDPAIPKGSRPNEMDYIRAIIKYLDDEGCRRSK